MIASIRKAWASVRKAEVRASAFGRRPRVNRKRLPNLTPEQQVAYDRACSFLADVYVPITGERARK